MAGVDPWVFNLIIFVLAVFVGHATVKSASHASHMPLAAMTSTLSGVIAIGALIAAGAGQISFSTVIGFLAIVLAAINIVGGLALSQRMLPVSEKEQERD